MAKNINKIMLKNAFFNIKCNYFKNKNSYLCKYNNRDVTVQDSRRRLPAARDADLGVFNTQRYQIVSGNRGNAFRYICGFLLVLCVFFLNFEIYISLTLFCITIAFKTELREIQTIQEQRRFS